MEEQQVEDAGVAPAPMPEDTELPQLVSVTPGAEPVDQGPQPRGALTVVMFTDGNWQLEMHGLVKLEVPTLLRLVAKRVEADLGV